MTTSKNKKSVHFSSLTHLRLAEETKIGNEEEPVINDSFDTKAHKFERVSKRRRTAPARPERQPSEIRHKFREESEVLYLT